MDESVALDETAPAKRESRRTIFALGVVAAAIAAYANTLPNGFVWDDASSILLHQHVQSPANVLDLFTEDQHAFAGGQGNFYRPLLSVTFMADYAFATGFTFEHESPETLSTIPFHFSSIIWHAAAALLFWCLALRLGASPGLATIAALVYAVHPLHSEAVAYISGRADSMAAAFIYAGVLAGLSGRANSVSAEWRAGILAALIYTAGLLSKESALILPGLLLVCLFLGPVRPSSLMAYVRRLGPSLAILAAYLVLRSTALNFGSDTTPPSSTFADRIVEALQALALYTQLIFYPAHLHMERTLEGTTLGTTLCGGLVLALLIAVLVRGFIAKRPLETTGAAWFILTWLPISGIFPLNAPLAEHWMYVPLGGFLLALFGLGDALINKMSSSSTNRSPLRIAAAVLVLVGVLALTAATVLRNRDWRSNEALYTATLRENPNSIRVHYNLAVTYQDLVGNVPGATRHYHEVLRLYDGKRAATPGSPMRRWQDELDSHLSLGQLYFNAGDLTRSARHFQEILNIEPNMQNRRTVGTAALGLSQCLFRMGRPEEARRYQEMALRLRPDLAESPQ